MRFSFLPKLRSHWGTAPVLEDEFEFGGKLRWSVGLEPALLNQSAAEWFGCLLILAGKVVLALRLAQLFENLQTVRGPGEGLPRVCAGMLSFPKPRIGGLFFPA